MLDWLITGWVTAGILYLLGMLATRNMVTALKNDLFGRGSAGDIAFGLLVVLFWPFAQLVATILIEGPEKPRYR